MSDLVSRVLAAIQAKEEKARKVQNLGVLLDWPRRNGKATLRAFLEDNDPASVIEGCEADRELVALHRQEGTDRRWECELCGPEGQNIDCTYPCDTLRLRARAYGISVEEETTQ